jgi:hypothetical protein
MDGYPSRLVRFNGETVDFQLNVNADLDRGKCGHNHITQSCLSCHTSKRKVRPTTTSTSSLLIPSNQCMQCDRKSPRSTCIQLGLVRVGSIRSSLLTLICYYHQTGLCVHEVDDPEIRDDLTVDEVTKLRNRVAELEDHPRSADNAVTQALATGSSDLSEKWHARTFKEPLGAGSQQLTIKTEPGYSPGYPNLHPRPGMYTHPSHDGCYPLPPPLSMDTSSTGSSSPQRNGVDPFYYAVQTCGAPTIGLSCRCLSNPTVTSQLTAFTRALHNVRGFLKRSADHNPGGCVVIDRMVDLNNLLL